MMLHEMTNCALYGLKRHHEQRLREIRSSPGNKDVREFRIGVHTSELNRVNAERARRRGKRTRWH